MVNWFVQEKMKLLIPHKIGLLFYDRRLLDAIFEFSNNIYSSLLPTINCLYSLY